MVIMSWLSVSCSRSTVPLARARHDLPSLGGFASNGSALAVLLLGWVVGVQAGPIQFSNASFESPRTPVAGLNVDSWHKAPKTEGYVEPGGFEWSQLIGQFKDPAVGQFDPLDNIRLVSSREPTLLPPAEHDSKREPTLLGEPGRTLKPWSSSNLDSPVTAWDRIAVVPNPSGSLTVHVDEPTQGPRFYRASQTA